MVNVMSDFPGGIGARNVDDIIDEMIATALACAAGVPPGA
jgi:hypothetical protein